MSIPHGSCSLIRVICMQEKKKKAMSCVLGRDIQPPSCSTTTALRCGHAVHFIAHNEREKKPFSQGYRTQFAHLAAAVTTAWLSVKFNLLQIKVCLGTEVRTIFGTRRSYTTNPKLFILLLNHPS